MRQVLQSLDDAFDSSHVHLKGAHAQNIGTPARPLGPILEVQTTPPPSRSRSTGEQ